MADTTMLAGQAQAAATPTDEPTRPRSNSAITFVGNAYGFHKAHGIDLNTANILPKVETDLQDPAGRTWTVWYDGSFMVSAFHERTDAELVEWNDEIGRNTVLTIGCEHLRYLRLIGAALHDLSLMIKPDTDSRATRRFAARRLRQLAELNYDLVLESRPSLSYYRQRMEGLVQVQQRTFHQPAKQAGEDVAHG